MLDLDSNLNFAVTLLTQYSFDLDNRTASELIDGWRQEYPAIWVCQSVIEALYQGRYKAVSVEQILSFWQRRGHALHHYNYEFERLICRNFPQTLTEQPVTFDHQDAPLDAVLQPGTSSQLPVQLIDTITKNEGESAPKKSACHQQQRRDNRRQIQQFTPIEGGSQFYTKLKAISQHSKHESEQNTGQ